jgi:hypothetical protein
LAERCSTFGAPGWPLAWPGPQDGLGQGGPRLKWAKGRLWSKNDEKIKVLRMGLPIVENLSGLQESIFSLSRSSQLHFGEKSKKNCRILLNLLIFPFSPCLGSLGLLSSTNPPAQQGALIVELRWFRWGHLRLHFP